MNQMVYFFCLPSLEEQRGREMMNPRTEKLVRRTTMVATVTASYFLLTADYGPEPNALDPVKDAIRSAQSSVKSLIFGSKNEQEGRESDDRKKHM